MDFGSERILHERPVSHSRFSGGRKDKEIWLGDVEYASHECQVSEQRCGFLECCHFNGIKGYFSQRLQHHRMFARLCVHMLYVMLVAAAMSGLVTVSAGLSAPKY